jgi:hypothetical protein
MSSTSKYEPTQEEINQAIDDGNKGQLARYLISLEQCKQKVGETIPQLTEAFGNAKRDLDVKRAAYKYFNDTIKTVQSVLNSMPRT